MAGRRPDTRWRTSLTRSAKQRPPEPPFWCPHTKPISEARPSCNSLAATLQKSTLSRSRCRQHGDRVRIAAVLLPCVLLIEAGSVHAQPCWSAGPVVPDRTYKLLTEDEDWSFLRDPALR